MSIVLTGGAGFIGSCILRYLNDAGIYDIIVVDHIASTDKWMNLRNKRFQEYINKTDFLNELKNYDDIELIIHMGAQSSTTEKDFDYLWKNNYMYTKTLWNYCAEKNIRFIYASSAATYGDGALGFDDQMDIDTLMPLNGYGYSKQVFDQWVKHEAVSFPKQHVGLKFFNVYGPNEYYKGTMASMVFHGFNQIKKNGFIRLFRSENPDYEDGKQLRDFIYVKDVCNVIMWLYNHPGVNGLFNVGTGRAQSFNELAESIFLSLELVPRIEYIEMPDNLKARYQYYTQAKINLLRESGYTKEFVDVRTGVEDYVKEYLKKGYKNF